MNSTTNNTELFFTSHKLFSVLQSNSILWNRGPLVPVTFLCHKRRHAIVPEVHIWSSIHPSSSQRHYSALHEAPSEILHINARKPLNS